MVEMTSTRQWQALVNGEIDIGFTRRVEPEFRTDLISEILHQDPIVAIVPKGHPVAPGPVDLRDLASEPFVLSSRDTSPTAQPTNRIAPTGGWHSPIPRFISMIMPK